jgi:hypothetical protein
MRERIDRAKLSASEEEAAIHANAESIIRLYSV